MAKKNLVNKTGYKKGTKTAENSYNVIPSNNITMEGVNEELLAIILDENNNPSGFKFMKPDKDYDFKNTNAVVEVPTYKNGGQPSQEWLSNKISKLLKDGTAKNRDQAVAIAYSMYNSDKEYQSGGRRNPRFPKTQDGLNIDLNNLEPETFSEFPELNAYPNSLQSVNTLQTQGINQPELDIEGMVQQQASNSMSGINPITGTSLDPNTAQKERFKPRERVDQIQFFNPYQGVDIPTASVALGQSIANKDTLGTVASSGKLLFGLARNTLGSYANQQRTNQVMRDYYNKQKQDLNTTTFLQQGGQMKGNIDNFEEELLKEILTSQKMKSDTTSVPQLDLGKYGNMNYFDVNTIDGQYLIKNTQTNPQNAAGFNRQIQMLRQQNPALNIRPEYQRYQDGGSSSLNEQDILNLQQEMGMDVDPTILNEIFEKRQPVVPDTVAPVNLGKYQDVGYFDVLENRSDMIQLQNTSKSPHTRETINRILPTLRQLNPDREININFQQGGSIDDILNFDEDAFINEILSEQQNRNQVQQPFNLGKYSDVGYFDVNTKNGKTIIKNTQSNPQNAAGFNMQLRQLRELNPNSNIVPQYMNFQKGGKVTDAELLTGEYMTGLDDENFNGEVEAGEYYQTNEGDIAEIKGQKHSNGGEKMNMEVGDRVLTDHTKLGAKNAKYIRDNFDLDIKAKHTYSDVLDKFRSKMGLNKLVDEEEKLIEKLEKEQEKKDSQSKKLNIDYLTNKIQDITQKKQPIEEARKVLFDKLFDLQESEKDEETKQEFEKGGVKKLAQDMGIDESKAFELYKQYKKGGYYQDGGDKKKVETEVVEGVNPYNNPEDFVNQSKAEGIFFGKATAERLQALQQNFPLLVDQTFNVERDDNGNIVNATLKEGKTIEDFQKAVDSNYQALINDAQKLGDPSRAKSFIDKVQQERFNNDIVARHFDSKLGNFTSSRPNFGFRSVTPEDLKKLKDQGITTYKQLVDDNGNIKEGVSLSPESKKLLEKYKGAESDFLLGDKDVIGTPESTKTLTRTENFVPNDTKGNLNLALLPDQYPMMPSPSRPHLKGKRRFQELDYEQIDPEPFLEEIFQQQALANRQLEGLPPNVAAAAQANNLANTQKAVSNTMLNIENSNLANRQRVNQINLEQGNRQTNADLDDALNYERRQYLSDAIAEQDLFNYYNQLQAVNRQNYLDINELNLRNALADDVQYRGDGTFAVSEAPDFMARLDALMAEQANKSKSKNK